MVPSRFQNGNSKDPSPRAGIRAPAQQVGGQSLVPIPDELCDSGAALRQAQGKPGLQPGPPDPWQGLRADHGASGCERGKHGLGALSQVHAMITGTRPIGA